MKFVTILISALLLNISALAHEGHDHEVPGNVQAPRGGMIKTGHEKYIESVVKPGLVEIYVYDHDLKPLDVKTLTEFSADILYPRAKKAETAKLEVENEHWVVRLGDKKVHRLTLNIHDAKGKEKTIFVIEPKR